MRLPSGRCASTVRSGQRPTLCPGARRRPAAARRPVRRLRGGWRRALRSALRRVAAVGGGRASLPDGGRLLACGPAGWARLCSAGTGAPAQASLLLRVLGAPCARRLRSTRLVVRVARAERVTGVLAEPPQCGSVCRGLGWCILCCAWGRSPRGSPSRILVASACDLLGRGGTGLVRGLRPDWFCASGRETPDGL